MDVLFGGKDRIGEERTETDFIVNLRRRKVLS